MINIKNILPFTEVFIGSNYKAYKHNYYLMYMKNSDTLNSCDFDKCEVSAMEWKSYEECMNSIRVYNIEKKRMLTQINNTLTTYCTSNWDCIQKYGIVYRDMGPFTEIRDRIQIKYIFE